MNTKKYRIIAGIAALAVVAGVFVAVKKISYKTAQTEIRVQEEERFSTLKIGFMPDWEYGSRKQLGAKMTRRAPVEMAKSILYLNQEFHPDIAIGGGDYIESSAVKPETAKEQLQEINEIFSLIQAPRLYALGNHDLRSLSKDEVRNILGMPDNHSVTDIGDWRIIVLDTNFTENGQHRSRQGYIGGSLSREELQWLQESLATDRPVLVFSHHSPIHAKNGECAIVQNISNELEVRRVLEETGNVVAVISGHNPTSYFERLNGVNYFVANTLVNVNALGSFVTIESEYDADNKNARILLKQLGSTNFEYRTEWKHGEKREDYKSPVTGPDEVLETEE